MGQSLSEPKTEKESSSATNERFVVASSSMQGWRVEMEDAHTIQLPVDSDSDSAFFAVFDGHGGSRFATYCSEHLHKELLSNTNFREGKYGCALKSSFLSLDRKLQEDVSLNFQYELGGTTAVAVLVKENQIFCANAGDSRAVASVAGSVQELSFDHKPYNPVEESRIYKAGGWIEFNRVNGNLALSRAFGDFNFKGNPELEQNEQIVTVDPDIVAVDITSDHEFMVLACDGIWDVMSNQEVVDFVRQRVARQIAPPLICEALLDHCLAPDCRMGGLGCDNMTIVLACFLHKEGGGYTELARRCSVGHVNSSPIHRTELQKTRSLQVPNGGLDSRDSLPHRCGCSPPPFPGISKLSPEHSTSIDAYLESESLNHSGSGSDSGLSPSPSGKRVINGLNGFGDEGVNDESSEEEDPVETTV